MARKRPTKTPKRKPSTRKSSTRRPTPKKAARKAPAKRKRSPKKPRALTADRLEEYVRVHAERLLEDPNVTSVGVGYKQVKGRKQPVLAIQFTVDTKVLPEALGAIETTPIRPTIEVDGQAVPTDVIERSFKPAYEVLETKDKDVRRRRSETLQPGMSVGGAATPGGSIGAFVRDKQTGRSVLLSNWHVLQGPAGALGNDVAQPGKHDDNRLEQNKVGQVLRSHLGAAGDCAIASVSGRAVSNAPVELPGVTIAAIGKPALHDRIVKSGRTTGVTYGRVSRVGVNTKMDYGGGVGAIVGGFEIEADPAHPAPENEISRAGDSGSTWLGVDAKGKPTGVMLGLHFAGDADQTVSEIALACYAESVMNKLEIEPLALAQAQSLADEGEAFRTGFDPAFLPFGVGVRDFSPARKKDLAALGGEREIPYCHFSVWLSKKRKYPLCVAWNIDGSRFVRLKRASFRTDRRGDLEEHQLTDDLYVNNPLDKGHVARRADLCWGSPDEAKVGNYDSFYFTNIAPQHQAFNQSDDRSANELGGVWGRLENAIFDSEAPHDLRVSLVGGPVFGATDPLFEQGGEKARIPKEFWKVVCYVDDDDGGREKVFGFLLTQAEIIKGLAPEGINLDEWVWARIALADLEAKTGVRLAQAMHQREVPFVAPQGLVEGVRLRPVFAAAEYFAG